MSYNGSGVFVINSSGQPVSANTLIEASVFNAFTADVATGLSTAITKDGQSTVTANLPMAGYRLTGLGAGSAAGHSLRYEQLFSTSAITLLGAMDWVKGANIASAATINLTTATGNAVHVTGATQIDAVTLGSGMWRMVIFDGILTLAHHATNNNLPGGANITTAANDRALYWSDGTTVYCAAYTPAAGLQTKDAELTAIAGLTSAANKVPRFTGSGTADLLDFKDEDNMASDSATAVPSQQSVKAYVDTSIAAIPAALTLGTPQATTSGSSVSITGIPSGTKRVTLMLNGVSTTGTSVPRVQLGDSGGLENSGYTAIAMGFAGTVASTDYTDGFGLRNDWTAARAANGMIIFCHVGSNVWVAQGAMQLAFGEGGNVTGIKTLSAELDRIGIVTADAFDAGSINILYE